MYPNSKLFASKTWGERLQCSSETCWTRCGERIANFRESGTIYHTRTITRTWCGKEVELALGQVTRSSILLSAKKDWLPSVQIFSVSGWVDTTFFINWFSQISLLFCTPVFPLYNHWMSLDYFRKILGLGSGPAPKGKRVLDELSIEGTFSVLGEGFTVHPDMVFLVLLNTVWGVKPDICKEWLLFVHELKKGGGVGRMKAFEVFSFFS